MRFLSLAVAALFAVVAFAGLHAGGASAQTGTTTATATATATQTATPTTTATGTATASATAAATPAACPSGVTLVVAPPTSGAPTTVTVTLTPPQNIKGATAGDPTSYHLHYFIDTAATAAGQAIPTGNPKIIHSGSLTQDLGTLAPGSHTVTVVLGQLSHVACETRGSVTFNVSAAPTAPKTGSGGLVATGGGSDAAGAFALLAVAAMLTLSGRLATRQER
ncbi:MAG: hypothetical protein AB7L91_04340 [Dehalococcoidia bacterium]